MLADDDYPLPPPATTPAAAPAAAAAATAMPDSYDPEDDDALLDMIDSEIQPAAPVPAQPAKPTAMQTTPTTSQPAAPDTAHLAKAGSIVAGPSVVAGAMQSTTVVPTAVAQGMYDSEDDDALLDQIDRDEASQPPPPAPSPSAPVPAAPVEEAAPSEVQPDATSAVPSVEPAHGRQRGQTTGEAATPRATDGGCLQPGVISAGAAASKATSPDATLPAGAGPEFADAVAAAALDAAPLLDTQVHLLGIDEHATFDDNQSITIDLRRLLLTFKQMAIGSLTLWHEQSADTQAISFAARCLARVSMSFSLMGVWLFNCRCWLAATWALRQQWTLLDQWLLG